MSAVDDRHATLAERLGQGVHNVLLLAPPMADRGEDACVDLLRPAASDGRNVLSVTCVQSPDAWLERMDFRQGSTRPNRLGVVDVGGSTRSAASSPTGGAAAERIQVETVSSPGNLTDLGIRISGFLEAWEAEPVETRVCLHSLTTLLQYADLRRVFRFLHVLTGRVRSVDAVAHYHMDPTAHESRDRNTLLALFDGVAELEDGEWTVRSR